MSAFEDLDFSECVKQTFIFLVVAMLPLYLECRLRVMILWQNEGDSAYNHWNSNDSAIYFKICIFIKRIG